jgi:ABC-type transporter Mla subunit MlaD
VILVKGAGERIEDLMRHASLVAKELRDRPRELRDIWKQANDIVGR